MHAVHYHSHLNTVILFSASVKGAYQITQENIRKKGGARACKGLTEASYPTRDGQDDWMSVKREKGHGSEGKVETLRIMQVHFILPSAPMEDLMKLK